MSLSLMKWIDQYLGAMLCLALYLVERLRRGRRRRGELRKILFIKLWGMGSILNAVPAFAAAKWGLRHTQHAIRDTEVHLLTFKRNAQICALLNAVDGVLLLDNPTPSVAFLLNLLQLLRRLRAERFDAVIDLEFFARFTTMLTYLSDAPYRVGFDSPKLWRSALYTHVAPFRLHAHITDCFLDLACCLGAQPAAPVPALKHCPIARLPNCPAPLVCLNPNASEVSHLSRWMPENFARLADELIDRYGVTVGLTGAPNEVAFVESVRRMARHADDIIVFAGRTSIPEFIALLKECRVFITNDSGPMHLAAVLGVPTIALFGPDTPTRYGPRGAQHTIFYKPPPCSPCYNFYNNKSNRCRHAVYQYCLKSITVEEVAEAAGKYLKREL
ncbi:MAG: glycosyltransferase family 9 protein [Abditibacteriales bacterium]|nr:glycosyltransferase family 9 protein [Abditibacteriales bacterium]MDW8365918.1 glycosyltransferase family 9 protein [Abditibacteriales bacterium]